MKEQEHGSVTQRFCLAILQKCSIREAIIPTLVDHDLIKWTINLLKKSLHQKIHVFCLDFSSAMLANIIHTPSTISFLEHHPEFTLDVIVFDNEAHGELLNLNPRINSCFSFDAHSHLPFLSFQRKLLLSNRRNPIRRPDFRIRGTPFSDQYSRCPLNLTLENEAAEIDKKTVLDLCAHMFHPKETTLENSETMELNELKTEDRIREYENEQGELIFECFQDEVS